MLLEIYIYFLFNKFECIVFLDRLFIWITVLEEEKEDIKII